MIVQYCKDIVSTEENINISFQIMGYFCMMQLGGHK